MKHNSQILRYLFATLLCLFLIPTQSFAQDPCANPDFEQSPAGAVTTSLQVSGWKITRDAGNVGNNCNMLACCPFEPSFSRILSTWSGFIDPRIGPIYPLYSVFGAGQNTAALNYNPQLETMGGDKVLSLNDFNSLSVFAEQAVKTITVTPTNNLLKVAYSIVLVPYHLCCDGAGFRMSISTTTCLLINTNACASNSLAGFYEGKTGLPATASSTLIFSKWKVKVIDLTPNIGQVVTLSVSASRCNYGAHAGYAYVDAECGTSLLSLNGTQLTSTLSTVTASTCTGNFTLSVEPFYESYLWSGPNGFQATGNVVITNQPGTYTVVLGQGDCDPVIRQVTINQPPPMVISSSNTTCAGQNAILTASGAATYTWLQTGAVSPSIAVHPEVTSVYWVNGTMSNGCALTGSFLIDPSPLPVLGVSSSSVLCSGATDTFVAAGASTYEWSDGSGFYSNLSYAVFSTNIASGPVNFTLSGTSSAGCRSAMVFSVDILPKPPLSIVLLPSDSVCPGTEVRLKGSGAVYYKWQGPGLQVSGDNLAFSANEDQHSGTYMLTGTDIYGCTSEKSAKLYVFPSPLVTIYGNRYGCEPFCTQLSAVAAPGKEIETTWKTKQNTSTSGEFSLCALPAGEYKIDLYLKDLRTTCRSSFSTEVIAYPLPVADFTTSPEVLSEFMEEIELLNTSKGENITYFKWYVTADVKLDTRSRDLVHIDKAGIYPVALNVRNAWGCEDTVVKPLVIRAEPLMYIPDAFTPNGDEINDVFKPVTNGPINYSFSIFDRWGKKIFEANQDGPGWDGTYKGSICQDDVYVCLVVVKDAELGDKKLERKISLLR